MSEHGNSIKNWEIICRTCVCAIIFVLLPWKSKREDGKECVDVKGKGDLERICGYLECHCKS